jgi:hypothetical protein
MNFTTKNNGLQNIHGDTIVDGVAYTIPKMYVALEDC